MNPRVPNTPDPPQLPFKLPQVPSNGDNKALNRGTLGGLDSGFNTGGLLDVSGGESTHCGRTVARGEPLGCRERTHRPGSVMEVLLKGV